jgi:hypothetical protein
MIFFKYIKGATLKILAQLEQLLAFVVKELNSCSWSVCTAQNICFKVII